MRVPTSAATERISRALPRCFRFQPKWDARRGARELYDAYKKVDLRVEDSEGARYKRMRPHPGIAGIGRLNSDLRLAGRGAERCCKRKNRKRVRDERLVRLDFHGD